MFEVMLNLASDAIWWLPLFLGMASCPDCGGRLDSISKPNPDKRCRCVICGKIWIKAGKHWQQIEKNYEANLYL